MRILAVDDDVGSLRYVTSLLARDHVVVGCSGGGQAIDVLASQGFDLVLTDLRMPPPDGFAVLRAAQALRPPTPVVVFTAVNTAHAAMDALKLGARDFVVKPAEPEELLAAVTRVGLDHGRSSGVPPIEEQFGLIGRSPAIREVHRLVPLLSRSQDTVLIQGETGTGKELLALAIHRQGPRKDRRFLAHNMAATPPELAESCFFGHARGAYSGAAGDHAGLFEQADGGTLFLDEIDSFHFDLQAKLLRVLESDHVQPVGSRVERPVNVRVIAASSADLGEGVARGSFRADLYYRLRQLEVALPPLRERTTDIPILARHFLAELDPRFGGEHRLAPATLQMLERFPWPGNVRELRNAIRSAALLAGGGPILPAHLPSALGSATASTAVTAAREAPVLGDTSTLRVLEREHVRQALERAGGNQSHAARLLGIDRGTLARKIRRFGLDRKP